MNPRNELRRRVSVKVTAQRLLALLTALVLVAAPAQAQRPNEDPADRKFDQHLRGRVQRGDDDGGEEEVIVRISPGARKGMVRRMQDQGLKIGRE